MSVSNGDILHVVIEALLDDGTIVQNRKRFQATFAAPLSDAVVLNAVKTWVETLYAYVASQVPILTQLQDGTVDIITWNGGTSQWEVTQNVGIYSPLDSFANGNDELPNQCAAFIIGNTSRPKTKGRLFVFPFAEDTQDHGVLTGAALTALGNFAAQYITNQAIGADSLWSGVVRETVNAFYGFPSVSYGDIIGTQRRRRFGIGV